MVTAADIVRHHQPDPDHDPWVDGPPPVEPVTIVAYDPDWPNRYERSASDVLAALGSTVMDIDHIGSTSVPGLAAKNVIDISMTVRNSADEDAYVPPLRAIGYVLTVREPSWHEHRCLRLDHPRVNLHVFGPDCPEVIRQRMFRDWLTCNPEDRALYERAKVAAIPGGGHVMDYNRRKEAVIREIYERAFRDAGLL